MAAQISSVKSIGGLFRVCRGLQTYLCSAFVLLILAEELPFSQKAHTYVAYIFEGNRLNIVQDLIGVYRGETYSGREKWMRLKELVKEKAEVASRSELARKMRVAKGFYTLEMAPPSTVEEMRRLNQEIKLLREFMRPGVIKLLTVKQAWLLLLVGIEVGLWFFLGETLGKFHIVGYKTSV